LFGATTFFQYSRGLFAKPKGKFDAALWNRPLIYYLNILRKLGEQPVLIDEIKNNIRK
jgi:hypothetical protein